jgi:hypothetical protein
MKNFCIDAQAKRRSDETAAEAEGEPAGAADRTYSHTNLFAIKF